MKLVCVQSPTRDADFFSGHHTITGREHGWKGNRPNDWSLILTRGGEGTITTDAGSVSARPGSLVLIAPGHPHSFYTAGNWNILWFHFLMRPHLPDLISWEVAAPGLYQAGLEGTDLRLVSQALKEANTLDLQRPKGWYALAYNLLESVLLRADNRTAAHREPADRRILVAQQRLVNFTEPSCMDEIAAECGVSRSSFYAQFKSAVGISPREYRELHALRRAQRLLENTQLPVSEIADQLGMSNIYYFSNRFKKFSGLSPATWRRKQQQAAAIPDKAESPASLRPGSRNLAETDSIQKS